MAAVNRSTRLGAMTLSQTPANGASGSRSDGRKGSPTGADTHLHLRRRRTEPEHVIGGAKLFSGSRITVCASAQGPRLALRCDYRLK